MAAASATIAQAATASAISPGSGLAATAATPPAVANAEAPRAAEAALVAQADIEGRVALAVQEVHAGPAAEGRASHLAFRSVEASRAIDPP